MTILFVSNKLLAVSILPQASMQLAKLQPSESNLTQTAFLQTMCNPLLA